MQCKCNYLYLIHRRRSGGWYPQSSRSGSPRTVSLSVLPLLLVYLCLVLTPVPGCGDGGATHVNNSSRNILNDGHQDNMNQTAVLMQLHGGQHISHNGDHRIHHVDDSPSVHSSIHLRINSSLPLPSPSPSSSSSSLSSSSSSSSSLLSPRSSLTSSSLTSPPSSPPSSPLPSLVSPSLSKPPLSPTSSTDASLVALIQKKVKQHRHKQEKRQHERTHTHTHPYSHKNKHKRRKGSHQHLLETKTTHIHAQHIRDDDGGYAYEEYSYDGRDEDYTLSNRNSKSHHQSGSSTKRPRFRNDDVRKHKTLQRKGLNDIPLSSWMSRPAIYGSKKSDWGCCRMCGSDLFASDKRSGFFEQLRNVSETTMCCPLCIWPYPDHEARDKSGDIDQKLLGGWYHFLDPHVQEETADSESVLYDRELREFRKSNSSKTVAPTPTTFLSLAQSRKQHTHEQLQQQRVRHQQAYGGGGGDRDDDDGDIDRKTHWIFKNPYQNVEKRDMSRQSEGNLAYEVTTNQGIHLKQNCSEEAAEDKAKGEGKEGEEGKGKEKEKGDAVSKGKVMTKCGGAGAGQPTIKNSDSGKSGAPTAAAEKEKEKEGEKKTTEGKEGEKINTSSSASTAKGRQDSEGGHKRRKGIMAGIHGSFRDGAGFDPSDIGVNAPDFPPCCNVCRPSHAGGGCCVPCDDGFDFRHDD